jgi:outer membrane protein assembly factor BamB
MFHGNPQRTGSSGGDIDTTNANLRWTFTVQGSAPSNVPSSPVVGKDGTVYVGSMGAGLLYAVWASTGGTIYTLNGWGGATSGTFVTGGHDGLFSSRILVISVVFGWSWLGLRYLQRWLVRW